MPKAAFEEKLTELKIPEDEWQVPFIFNGQEYLSGDKAIEAGLKEFLKP